MADDVRRLNGPEAQARAQAALLEHAREILMFTDTEGRMVFGAGGGLKRFGYAPRERAGESVLSVVHPDDRPRVADLVQRAWRADTLRERVRVRAQTRAGTWLLIEADVETIAAHPVLGDGAIVRIRELGDVDREVPPMLVDERFNSLTAALPAGVLTLTPDGAVLDANEAAADLLARPAPELLGSRWLDRVVPEDRERAVGALEHAGGAGGRATEVLRVALDRGEERWVKASAVRVGSVTQPVGTVVCIEDVTERHRVMSELGHRATHDALTGLPNRVLLEDRLRRSCARLGDEASSVCVLFCDLDGFKAVNDRHGHDAGDRVLREVAARLGAAVREGDTVARLAGDEFVIVCENLGRVERRELVGRLGEVVRSPMEVEGRQLRMEMSVGTATATEPGTEPPDLLAEADAAMYRAKATRQAG